MFHQITEIIDPFVAAAPTRAEARLGLGGCLTHMYGLDRAEAELGPDVCGWAVKRAEQIFRFTTQNRTAMGPRFERTADGEVGHVWCPDPR